MHTRHTFSFGQRTVTFAHRSHGLARPHRVAHDTLEAPTILVTHATELRAIQENWPGVEFYALREHGGLVFQSRLQAA